jgi:oxysterol-binding protein-related protein 9/10/11
MLYVLEIYLSSLQRQYYIGQPVSAGTKKPLNPFLGELFFAECRDDEGKSSVKVICEQVSHHPPTTAAFIEDEVNGVRVSILDGEWDQR